MSYTIKKLSASDLSLAKELIVYWETEEGKINPKIPSDAYLQDLLSKDSFHVFVAIENDRVVGGISGYELIMFPKEEVEMFLYEIGVHEDYRQKGIAAALIESLKAVCKEKNIRVIFVGTSTDNDATKRLYESTGGELEIIPWYTYNL